MEIEHQTALPGNVGQLNSALRQILKNAAVKKYSIPLYREIQLWLIDPEGWDLPLSEQETDAAFDAPPYWSFCWGSGKALADYLLRGDLDVTGKTVLDFGSGSGVVAIAAAMAGAARVICCDKDPLALQAARANAQLNRVVLDYLDDFDNQTVPVDYLFAADVLYDPDNFSLLEKFKTLADKVIIADSRVKDFSAQGFRNFLKMSCITEPDLGENLDVHTVRFYRF